MLRERSGTGAGRSAIGLRWAAGTAVVSGFAIWVNRFGVAAWSDAGGSLPYTTAKNLVAAMVLIGMLLGLSRHTEAASTARSHWRGLLAVAVVGGGIPFALFFEGLSRATSTQAAFIHKTLVLWVAAMAIPLLGEKVKGFHFAAIGLLIAGQVALAGGVAGITVGAGEMMILIATLMWSIEVIIAKRLLADVRPLEVGVARMAGGAAVLVLIGLFNGSFGSLAALGWSQIGWVAVTGVALSAYVFTWMNALSLAPATDVTAVLVGSVIVTSMLEAGPVGLVGAAAPGLALIAVGVALVLLRPRPAAARV